MARQNRRMDSARLLHPTATSHGRPLRGIDGTYLPEQGNPKVENNRRKSFRSGTGSFSDPADHYAQVDWTPWDCCRCAAETRDAMLEKVADAFGRYALFVYRHPIKFIVFSALLCLTLSVGLAFKTSTTDGVVQYTIPHSQAQQDADDYRMLFQGNVTRSEVILIAANDEMSNLLDASFLNAVWDMHMKILDIRVTAEEEGDALADAAVAIAETGDTLELPSRRLQYTESFDNRHRVTYPQRSESKATDAKQLQMLTPRKLAWGDPASIVQQHFVEQQLRQQLQQQNQQPQWIHTGGGGRRRREAQDAAAAQHQQQQEVFPSLQAQESEGVCDPERELPRVRITGLACRPPLAAGEYGFQNLCFKDSTGACEAPDGIIFVYGHKREFGSMVEYPLHTSFLLARGFPTDMLLSTKGLRLTPSGRYATATAAISLRLQVYDCETFKALFLFSTSMGGFGQPVPRK